MSNFNKKYGDNYTLKASDPKQDGGPNAGGQTVGGHTLQPWISDLGTHVPGGGQMLGGQTLGGHTLQPRISDLAGHLPVLFRNIIEDPSSKLV